LFKGLGTVGRTVITNEKVRTERVAKLARTGKNKKRGTWGGGVGGTELCLTVVVFDWRSYTTIQTDKTYEEQEKSLVRATWAKVICEARNAKKQKQIITSQKVKREGKKELEY